MTAPGLNHVDVLLLLPQLMDMTSEHHHHMPEATLRQSSARRFSMSQHPIWQSLMLILMALDPLVGVVLSSTGVLREARAWIISKAQPPSM